MTAVRDLPEPPEGAAVGQARARLTVWRWVSTDGEHGRWDWQWRGTFSSDGAAGEVEGWPDA